MKTKKLFAILTLVVFMMTLLPLASFAATNNTALTVPVLTTASTSFGTVRMIEQDSSAGAVLGTQVTFTLPAGVTFAGGVAPTFIAGETIAAGLVGGRTWANHIIAPLQIPGTANANLITGADVSVVDATAKTLTVNVRAVGTGGGTKAALEFAAPAASVAMGSASGELFLNIYSTSTAWASGDVMVGRIGSTGTVATALTAPGRNEGAAREIGILRIVENTPGALVAGANTITITAPEGYTFTGVGTVRALGGYAAINEVVAGTLNTNSAGRHQFRLTVVTPTAAGATPGIIEVSGVTVNIDASAKLGDAVFSIGGTNAGISAQQVVLAKKVDYEVKVSAESVPTLYSGGREVTPGAIRFQEMSAITLPNNRTIRLTLPDGMEWTAVPVFRSITGNAMLNAGTIAANTNNRTVSYTVTAGTSATTFVLERGEIIIRGAKAEGPMIIKVEGTAGINQEVTVAEVKKPITTKVASLSNINIGVQGQVVQDITIEEVVAGNIKARLGGVQQNFQLRLPAGASWAAAPKVTVESGDLKLDLNNISTAGRLVTIPVLTSSEIASTIKISGGKVSLDRTVPEGEFKIAVLGNAVIPANSFVGTPAAWISDDVATSTVLAQVVTPAPGDEFTKGEVTMEVGSTVMKTLEGDVPMDVAPYVKGGRTFFPVTYVAQALGVRKDNIMWDAESKAVTILTDSLSIQMTIGNRNMIRNGVAIPMDASPEIYNGRTMLPIRWLAQYGLGRTVDFADGKVTIK